MSKSIYDIPVSNVLNSNDLSNKYLLINDKANKTSVLISTNNFFASARANSNQYGFVKAFTYDLAATDGVIDYNHPLANHVVTAAAGDKRYFGAGNSVDKGGEKPGSVIKTDSEGHLDPSFLQPEDMLGVVGITVSNDNLYTDLDGLVTSFYNSDSVTAVDGVRSLLLAEDPLPSTPDALNAMTQENLLQTEELRGIDNLVTFGSDVALTGKDSLASGRSLRVYGSKSSYVFGTNASISDVINSIALVNIDGSVKTLGHITDSLLLCNGEVCKVTNSVVKTNQTYKGLKSLKDSIFINTFDQDAYDGVVSFVDQLNNSRVEDFDMTCSSILGTANIYLNARLATQQSVIRQTIPEIVNIIGNNNRAVTNRHWATPTLVEVSDFNIIGNHNEYYNTFCFSRGISTNHDNASVIMGNHNLIDVADASSGVTCGILGSYNTIRAYNLPMIHLSHESGLGYKQHVSIVGTHMTHDGIHNVLLGAGNNPSQMAADVSKALYGLSETNVPDDYYGGVTAATWTNSTDNKGVNLFYSGIYGNEPVFIVPGKIYANEVEKIGGNKVDIVYSSTPYDQIDYRDTYVATNGSDIPLEASGFNFTDPHTLYFNTSIARKNSYNYTTLVDDVGTILSFRCTVVNDLVPLYTIRKTRLNVGYTPGIGLKAHLVRNITERLILFDTAYANKNKEYMGLHYRSDIMRSEYSDTYYKSGDGFSWKTHWINDPVPYVPNIGLNKISSESMDKSNNYAYRRVTGSCWITGFYKFNSAFTPEAENIVSVGDYAPITDSGMILDFRGPNGYTNSSSGVTVIGRVKILDIVEYRRRSNGSIVRVPTTAKSDMVFNDSGSLNSYIDSSTGLSNDFIRYYLISPADIHYSPAGRLLIYSSLFDSNDDISDMYWTDPSNNTNYIPGSSNNISTTYDYYKVIDRFTNDYDDGRLWGNI